jgi:dUTP pyrophosphatase
MNRPKMKVLKLSENATIPTRNNPDDAGLDLYAAEEMSIPAGEGRMVKTDIAIELPENTVGMICDRSGMGKKGFKVHGGIVDVPYRGSVNVILWNHTGVDAKIFKGDRVGQLLVIPILFPELEEVKESLSETVRGDKGFGSSGN